MIALLVGSRLDVKMRWLERWTSNRVASGSWMMPVCHRYLEVPMDSCNCSGDDGTGGLTRTQLGEETGTFQEKKLAVSSFGVCLSGARQKLFTTGTGTAPSCYAVTLQSTVPRKQQPGTVTFGCAISDIKQLSKALTNPH